MMEPVEPRPLTRLERWTLAFLNFAQRRTEGFTVTFTEDLVRAHGVADLFRASKVVSRAWKNLNAWFGSQDAHLLASAGSFWNGCRCCAVGHLGAHNLELFERTGELFPVDETEVPALLRQTDAEILSLLRRKLSPRYERQLRLIERMQFLKTASLSERERTSSDAELDHRLDICNALYEWVNDCSIQPEEPEALTLNRRGSNKELLARYKQARAATRASPQVA
jgi:hypothetical protein